MSHIHQRVVPLEAKLCEPGAVYRVCHTYDGKVPGKLRTVVIPYPTSISFDVLSFQRANLEFLINHMPGNAFNIFARDIVGEQVIQPGQMVTMQIKNTTSTPRPFRVGVVFIEVRNP